MPDPKNKSLEGVPLFDDRIDIGLYTTVSVPLVSLTPPAPVLPTVLRLPEYVLAVADLLDVNESDFFFSIVDWVTSEGEADTFLFGM